MNVTIAEGVRLYRAGSSEPFTGGMTLDVPDKEAASLIAAKTAIATPVEAPATDAPHPEG